MNAKDEKYIVIEFPKGEFSLAIRTKTGNQFLFKGTPAVEAGHNKNDLKENLERIAKILNYSLLALKESQTALIERNGDIANDYPLSNAMCLCTQALYYYP